MELNRREALIAIGATVVGPSVVAAAPAVVIPEPVRTSLRLGIQMGGWPGHLEYVGDKSIADWCWKDLNYDVKLPVMEPVHDGREYVTFEEKDRMSEDEVDVLERVLARRNMKIGKHKIYRRPYYTPSVPKSFDMETPKWGLRVEHRTYHREMDNTTQHYDILVMYFKGRDARRAMPHIYDLFGMHIHSAAFDGNVYLTTHSVHFSGMNYWPLPKKHPDHKTNSIGVYELTLFSKMEPVQEDQV